MHERPSICGWEDCPGDVRQVVTGVLDDFKAILGDNLIGFYLHGSLAMRCFVAGDSDIDFLAIVKRRLTIVEKKAIIAALLRRTEDSVAGDLEMSTVREEHVQHPVHPTPFELHYNAERAEDYDSGREDYLALASDEDLAAHFTATRQAGISLYGKPISDMFLPIPREMFVQSLVGDADWILTQLDRHPVYAVLNLCRVLAFLIDEAFTSKKEGGEWALEHLPAEFSPVIGAALTRYSADSQATRPESGDVHRFAEYALPRIHSLAG